MELARYNSGEYLEANPTWHAEDSPWKADQIRKILERNAIHPRLIAEIGCGTGAILSSLEQETAFSQATFRGYDISAHAIDIAKKSSSPRLTFFCGDMFLAPAGEEIPDVLLIIDVLEHIPDYMGFATKCRALADLKVYHIPLDIHVSAVLRDTFDYTRQKVGHLHSFTASSAISTLKDTGHEIIDQFYTNGAIGTFKQRPSAKRALANVPRWCVSKFSVPLSARLFGGYSLLVLAR